MNRFDKLDPVAVLKRPQLLKLLALLKGRGIQIGKLKEKIALIAVKA